MGAGSNPAAFIEAQQWVSFFIHKNRFTKQTNREVVIVARKRNPKTDEAEKLFCKGLKLKDIASRLEVPEGTVRRWKNTYKWDSERSKKKANVRNKGGQKGNRNAVGDGAPPGNTNAEKYGFFRKYLPEETVSIIEEMPKDPLDVLWDQIQIAYAAIIRAQQIMYVKDREDKTTEITSDGDAVTGYEHQQAWDKQGNFLSAQARAQKTLESMINRYDDMLHKNWELATEEQRARIERIKADTERIKGGEQTSTEDKVAKLFDAIGAELDAE